MNVFIFPDSLFLAFSVFNPIIVPSTVPHSSHISRWRSRAAAAWAPSRPGRGVAAGGDTRAALTLALGSTLGMGWAGQGCEKMETSPAVALLGHRLMAPWGWSWGLGPWTAWGKPQERFGDSLGWCCLDLLNRSIKSSLLTSWFFFLHNCMANIVLPFLPKVVYWSRSENRYTI